MKTNRFLNTEVFGWFVELPLQVIDLSGRYSVMNFFNLFGKKKHNVPILPKLHSAASKGHTQWIKEIINSGVEINEIDSTGKTPLDYAIQGGHKRAINILSDAGGKKAEEVYLSSNSMDNKRGVSKAPSKSDPCTECGAPVSKRMMERGVHPTFNGIFARFPCPSCHQAEDVYLEDINMALGINVRCPSCKYIAYVPPSVWCKTCGIGLSNGWQDQVS